VNYRVLLADEVERLLDRLDRPTERRVRRRFSQLAEDPFDPRLSSPLAERPGVRKSRVGGWRVLFSVDREARVVYIATVDRRGQVYRRLG
jgi:mRNA interferase RelE/StbE